MSQFEDIIYSVEDGAAIITINRPERYNAFRGQTVEELIEAFRLAWADNAVRSVILTGAGEKAFFRLLGCYGAPGVVFYHRFAIRDKAAVRELVEQVRTWNPQRIVMGHGRIIEDSTAAELFAAAWRRFG